MANSINIEAFEQAVRFAEKKFKKFTCGRDMLETLIRTMLDKFERNSFTDALRFTLNEHHLWDKKKTGDLRRTWYRSAVAKYFSINSAIARRTQGTKSKQVTYQPKPSKVHIIEESSGQLGWMI